MEYLQPKRPGLLREEKMLLAIGVRTLVDYLCEPDALTGSEPFDSLPDIERLRLLDSLLTLILLPKPGINNDLDVKSLAIVAAAVIQWLEKLIEFEIKSSQHSDRPWNYGCESIRSFLGEAYEEFGMLIFTLEEQRQAYGRALRFLARRVNSTIEACTTGPPIDGLDQQFACPDNFGTDNSQQNERALLLGRLEHLTWCVS